MTDQTPHLPFEVELDDGTPLLLRLGTPDDREALIAGFERLSPESRVKRFFTAMPKLSELFLDRLADVDRSRHVAVAAQDLSRVSDVDEPDEGLGVGVGRYIVSEDDPSRAEMAIAVIDEYQRRGIGRLLLEALVTHAVDNGVKSFGATVLSSNDAALGLLGEIGATLDWDPDDATVIDIQVPIPADPLEHSELHRLLARAAAAGAPTDAD